MESTIGPICFENINNCGAISIFGEKDILNISAVSRERGEPREP